MFVTFTANPSLDRSADLPGALTRGGVHRLGRTRVDPGGKGVNVARVLHLAGRSVIAVLPAGPDDPLLTALREHGVAHRAVAVPQPARGNLTLTEPDGTTTKLNEPGAPLPADAVARLEAAVAHAAVGASWVVLSGSLPPGAPLDWYARLVAAARPGGARIAVDTSDAPLLALAAAFPQAAPDLLKPNSEELAQLVGRADGADLEARAAAGDVAPIVAAAQALRGRGVGTVLATLGAAGAVLVTQEGAWYATPPPITPRSTVGAGDSCLSGYVLAHADGAAAPDALALAVAYGSAAAALPGTGLPSPDLVRADEVRVTRVDAGPSVPAAASSDSPPDGSRAAGSARDR